MQTILQILATQLDNTGRHDPTCPYFSAHHSTRMVLGLRLVYIHIPPKPAPCYRPGCLTQITQPTPTTIQIGPSWQHGHKTHITFNTADPELYIKIIDKITQLIKNPTGMIYHTATITSPDQ